MVTDLGAGVGVLELVGRHVGELVELELVRLVVLVGSVDVLDVALEHVEPLVLVPEAPRDRVVAAPPLVEVPKALVGLQVLVVDLEALRDREDEGERESHQEKLLHHLHIVSSFFFSLCVCVSESVFLYFMKVVSFESLVGFVYIVEFEWRKKC